MRKSQRVVSTLRLTQGAVICPLLGKGSYLKRVREREREREKG